MFTAISITGIPVLDQREALDFYVGKLGFQVSNDVDMGFMRWLTICLPADPDRHLLLEVPGPPALAPETAAQVRELLTRGALGLAFVVTTDDCRRVHAELSARGVEFSEPPTEQPYGIDCALRDPFGNQIRITQHRAGPVEITDEDRRRWAGEAAGNTYNVSADSDGSHVSAVSDGGLAGSAD